MVVNEEDVVNIMGGMEHATGIKLNDHKRKLKNRFEICRKLGQGTYGKVQLGINKETGQQVAIKTIKKSKIETDADLIRIRREIQIMSSVQHPNIIHIYEVFENKEKMVLVMEIAAGGELYDYLSERKSLDEVEARRVFRQIATAVYYCHKHNICHRDLKLENILLDEDGGAKIADFGLSNVFDRRNLLSTFCGSPLYASPEIVRGCPYQGPEVDCWSLGVLLYTLVYGAMPFDGSNFKRLVKQITTGDYYEPKQPSSASSLIKGMLTVAADQRASILDICSHWWVNQGYSRNCLEEAEHLASLTPVRLDLLLSLTRQENRQTPDEIKSEVTTPTNKETIAIEEIPIDADIPAGIEECDVSLSEEPTDDQSPELRRRVDQKRKLKERISLVEQDISTKKLDNKDSDEMLLPPPPPKTEAPRPTEYTDQVYQRPRDMIAMDQKKDSGDGADDKFRIKDQSIDTDKTPKVRRRHKSSGEKKTPIHMEKKESSPKQPCKPSSADTPKTKRNIKKSPKPVKREVFEQPEPQDSRATRGSPLPEKLSDTYKFENKSPLVTTPPASSGLPLSISKETTEDVPVLLIPTKSVSLLSPKTVKEKPTSTLLLKSDVEMHDGLPPPMTNIELRSGISPSKSSKEMGSLDINSSAITSVTETTGQKSSRLHQLPSSENTVDLISTEIVRQDDQPPPLPQKKRKSKGDSEKCMSRQNEVNNESKQNVHGVDNNTCFQEKQQIEIIKSPVPPLSIELETHCNVESLLGKSCIVDDPKQHKPPLSNLVELDQPPTLNLASIIQFDEDKSNNCKRNLNFKQSKDVNKDAEKIGLVIPHPTKQLNSIESSTLSSLTQRPNEQQITMDMMFADNSLCPQKQQKSMVSSKNETFEDTPEESKETSAYPPKEIRNKKASSKPSINNLPKLVIASTNTEVNENKRVTSPIVEAPNNSISRIKTMSPSPKSLSNQDIYKEKSLRSDLPIVKPFPGKTKEPFQPSNLVKQESPKNIMNNIPKPFKAEEDKPTESFIEQNAKTERLSSEANKLDTGLQTRTASKSTDSVGSCISISSDEGRRSEAVTPSILPKPNGPNINYSTLSPSSSKQESSSIKGPEKRDSKVIKAAAYWNNYIGEVNSKSKPPSNPKLLDKPKKITSAGIGERGLKELTSAFEHGKPILQEDKFSLTRRNSKKVSVDSCNPGLRVNDAKSVFEKKFQQLETPKLNRRASGSLDLSKDISRNSNLDSEKNYGLQPQTKSKSPAKESVEEPNFEANLRILKIEKTLESPDLGHQKDVIVKTVKNIEDTIPVNSENISTRQNKKQENSVQPVTENDSKKDTNLKPVFPLRTSSQPKPPTSPKPKVKKVNNEIVILKNDKKGSHINIYDNVPILIPPLSTKDKDTAEEARIIQLKESEPNLQENKVNNNELSTQVNNVEPSISDPVQTSKTGEITKLIFKKKVDNEEENKLNCNESTEDRKSMKKMTNSATNCITKTVMSKSPEPEKLEVRFSPEPNLSEIKSSLKKVIHPILCRTTSSPEADVTQLEVCPAEIKSTVKAKSDIILVNKEDKNMTDLMATTQSNICSAHIDNKLDSMNSDCTKHSLKERIIPITLVKESAAFKPFKVEADLGKLEKPFTDNSGSLNKSEHHIPIKIEGNRRHARRYENNAEDPETTERMDNFNANTMSRRRWGSRKKRMSSAFSDSSVSDDDALSIPLSGLQKYTSYGKHGLGEQPLFRLKKTRPPFSNDKVESFSSGEDDFDDDGFQEMTAENLFSTLLSRVKSLTRRIHDEHDEHINWQRTRHGPPKLNPGGTHARLERTAQRNSTKREPYSRQSSNYDDSSQRSYIESPIPRSAASSYYPTNLYSRSYSNNESDSQNSTVGYSTNSTKRYDESDSTSDFSGSISVTSSQKLRPGYLPPPSNHNTASASNTNLSSYDNNDLNAQNFDKKIFTNKANEIYEPDVPINIKKCYTSESTIQSNPGKPHNKTGVYIKHMKPFSLNSLDNNDRSESSDASGELGDRQRRVSRFLRPDFYDIPKENSIYAKMKELEDEDKKKPRFLRIVQSRGKDGNSGRSTPLDLITYSEDRTRSDTMTPFGDNSSPNSEGGRITCHRPMIHEHNQHHTKKSSANLGVGEQDALMVGIKKLKKQGLEHSVEVSEISDGLRTPESVSSDIFGVPEFVVEGEDSFRERFGRSPYQPGVDDSSRPLEKKLVRQTVSRELFNDPSARYKSTRPLAHRSLSRELFDLRYNTGQNTSCKTQTIIPESRHTSRYSRLENSFNNLDFSEDGEVSSGYKSTYTGGDRSRSISRGLTSRPELLLTRTPLSEHGRSYIQNEILRSSPLTVGRMSEDEGDLGRSFGLRERNRQDWRRISVPERGQDYNSLPRKYKRADKKTFL